MDHLVETDIKNTMVLVRTTGYMDHLVKETSRTPRYWLELHTWTT